MKDLIRTILMFALIASGIFSGTDIITTRKKMKLAESEGEEFNSFILTYPVIIKILMIISMIFCTALAIAAFMDGDLWTAIGFFLFAIMAVWAVLGTVVWRVEFKDNIFIYRNYFGIKRRIPANEITKVIDRQNRHGQSSLSVYSGENKLFTIDEMTENMYTFYAWALNQGIEVGKIKSNRFF